MSKTITIRRKTPRSVAELIELWPTYQDLADDLGLTIISIYAMRARNSISKHHWRRLVKSASKHGIEGVTLELLAELAEKRMAS